MSDLRLRLTKKRVIQIFKGSSLKFILSGYFLRSYMRSVLVPATWGPSLLPQVLFPSVDLRDFKCGSPSPILTGTGGMDRYLQTRRRPTSSRVVSLFRSLTGTRLTRQSLTPPGTRRESARNQRFLHSSSPVRELFNPSLFRNPTVPVP